jgi:hypothetical protein
MQTMQTKQTPGFWIAFLRIAVGASWIVAAVEKIINPAYDTATLLPTLQQWSADPGPIGLFVAATLMPHVEVLSFALKALEMAVGVSLVVLVTMLFLVFAPSRVLDRLLVRERVVERTTAAPAASAPPPPMGGAVT